MVQCKLPQLQLGSALTVNSQKVKIAKRDKTLRQQEYFEKKKVDAGGNAPKRINDAVFQSFSVSTSEKEVQDPPNLERNEAYLSKDYLLLTSRAKKPKPTQAEEPPIEQDNEELSVLPNPQPVQMPTTLASDMGAMKRLSEAFDRGKLVLAHIVVLSAVSAVHRRGHRSHRRSVPRTAR